MVSYKRYALALFDPIFKKEVCLEKQSPVFLELQLDGGKIFGFIFFGVLLFLIVHSVFGPKNDDTSEHTEK
jgi:hypothetical protein